MKKREKTRRGGKEENDINRKKKGIENVLTWVGCHDMHKSLDPKISSVMTGL